jgi:hypothetical protein
VAPASFCDERQVDGARVSVRRLAVITGLGPTTEETVRGVVAGLEPDGWQLMRRPRLGAAYADHVILGPGGVFLVVVRGEGGRVRPEWADEARARAALLAWLTRRSVTPLVVLERPAEWSDARRFHGVDVVPVAGLARHLGGHEEHLSAGEVALAREALRMALAA